MSVQCNQYIGYGYLVPYAEARDILIDKVGEDRYEDICFAYHDSAFSPEIIELNGCSMLWDGMGGQYLFFGKLFSKSAEGEPLPPQKIAESTPGLDITVGEEALRIFGTDFGETPSMYLITHYR